jgi:hypothetical protein
MRMAPVVGRKPWFGPRRLGWGLGPVSWEGWIVTVVLAAAAVAVRSRPGGQRIAGGIAAAMVVIALLKGTSPGGPRARRSYDEGRAKSRKR